MVQTKSQSKSSEVDLPEVHGVQKGIDPHVKPEKQVVKPTTVLTETKQCWEKLRLGQGRAGLRRKIKMVMPSQPNQSAQKVAPSEKT